MAGRPLPGHPDLQRPHRRGAGPALYVALLAGPAAQGTHRYLRRLLVHRNPGAGHGRGDVRGRSRSAPGPDQPLRGHAGQRGGPGPQVLVSPDQARTAGAAHRPGKRPPLGLAGDQGRLAPAQTLQPLAGGGGPPAATDQHPLGALGGGRRQRRPLPDAASEQRLAGRPAAAPGRPPGSELPGGAAHGAEYRPTGRADGPRPHPEADAGGL